MSGDNFRCEARPVQKSGLDRVEHGGCGVDPIQRPAVAPTNYNADMRLPEGRTCADCVNGTTCDALFGAVRRKFTSCDFWPSRFRPALSSATSKEGAGE